LSGRLVNGKRKPIIASYFLPRRMPRRWEIPDVRAEI